MTKRRKRRSGIRAAMKAVLDTGIFLLVVLLLTYLLSNYVVARIVVHNHSMEDTLEPESSVLIDKISYKFKDPERFDIIVFKQTGTGEELIKRIIALPYETIQIIDGIIYIDGEVVEDVKGLDRIDNPGVAANRITLSAGEYFVIGDNRELSVDSRSEEIGLVTNTRIIGRAFLRLWTPKFL